MRRLQFFLAGVFTLVPLSMSIVAQEELRATGTFWNYPPRRGGPFRALTAFTSKQSSSTATARTASCVFVGRPLTPE